MRDLSTLQAMATSLGLDASGSRESLMDAIRDKMGSATDIALNLDPMKADSLKREIDWTKSGVDRFLPIPELNQPDRFKLEPKLDGARMRLFIDAEGNRLFGGRRSDVTMEYIERTDNFPHIRDMDLSRLAGTVFDCEAMPPARSITTASGVVTKGTLNSVMALVNVNPQDSVRTQEREGWMSLEVFDVLTVRGVNVMGQTYDKRRSLLDAAIPPDDEYLRLIPSFDADPYVMQAFLDSEYEGGMLKLRSGIYEPGRRSKSWLKIKTMSTGDFYIIGSVDGKGRNSGMVGSFKVACWGESGEDVYVADVAGIDDALRSSVSQPNWSAKYGYLREDLVGTVIEVMAQCVTKNLRLRHPHFVRWRTDKAPADCGVEQLKNFPEA